MKRILLSAALSTIVCISFAQKSAVKEAKSALGSEKFGDARTLIKPALTNPETANDAETWKVAGDIEFKSFDKEKDKQILGELSKEKVNEEVMYNGLYNCYDPYIKADELGQIPDAKGKVKNKFRKDIANSLKTNHAYFINGGIFFNEKKNYSKAADFFQRYWELPSLSMFDDDKEKINTNDSTFQIIKYYAVMCANYAEDHPRAIKMLQKIAQEPFVENSVYKESGVYELLASQYYLLGDTVKFIETLELGAKRFPQSNYFVTNLVNEFIKKKQPEQALAYLDQAIANDPSNACEFHSVKASIYAEKADFENAFAGYQAALAADENCEKALEGLAVSYIVSAQDLKQKSANLARKEQVDLDAQANELYTKSVPLLEKLRSLLEARQASTAEIKTTLYKLRNVYYNLNLNEKFDAADKAYNEL